MQNLLQFSMRSSLAFETDTDMSELSQADNTIRALLQNELRKKRREDVSPVSIASLLWWDVGQPKMLEDLFFAVYEDLACSIPHIG